MFAVLVGFLVVAGQALGGLKPFPLSAGQRGTVACLENPFISYDIYLPSTYRTNGTPLPILYTLNPSGGGLVTQLEGVCASLNMIVVGVMSSKDGAPLNLVLRDFYAVPHDVRQRVRFDPSAEFIGGFSGGGENSYIFARFWAQHVSGIFAMSGWSGCVYGTGGTIVYYPTSEVLTNVLIARTTGTSDDFTQTNWLAPDGVFFTSCGAIVNNWTFMGGHAIPPDSTKTACLAWLLNNRILPGANDESNSLVQAANWRSRIAAGQSDPVFRECVSTLLNQPRTWFALQAQFVMDDLMTNYNTFRTINVSNLAQGEFASSIFLYPAFGAATNKDWQRYDGNLKALTGVFGTNNDRAGDIFYLESTFGYPAPLLQMSSGGAPGLASAWLREDTPGLAYSLSAATDLFLGDWQAISPDFLDTNATWSATVNFNPASTCGFYRVATTPVSGYSPPWPNGFSGL